MAGAAYTLPISAWTHLSQNPPQFQVKIHSRAHRNQMAPRTAIPAVTRMFIRLASHDQKTHANLALKPRPCVSGISALATCLAIDALPR
ncbi:hypothetical protein BST61_g8122 [Cercospora zeina]